MDVEVTSVSKAPERLFPAAAAVEVITSEDLRRAGVKAAFPLNFVRFAINHSRARAVGLEISSRLLGLARLVESTTDTSGGPR